MAIESGDEAMPTVRVEGGQWAFSLPRQTRGLPTGKFVLAIQRTIPAAAPMLHDKSHGARAEMFGLWLGWRRVLMMLVQLILEIFSSDLLIEPHLGYQ